MTVPVTRRCSSHPSQHYHCVPRTIAIPQLFDSRVTELTRQLDAAERSRAEEVGQLEAALEATRLNQQEVLSQIQENFMAASQQYETTLTVRACVRAYGSRTGCRVRARCRTTAGECAARVRTLRPAALHSQDAAQILGQLNQRVQATSH